MNVYPLIPGAIFFACCFAQFPMRGRVIRALERHPQVLDDIGGALMLGWGLHSYIMRNDYQRLGDAELNRHIRNYRRLTAVALCAWLVFAVCVNAGVQRG